jgi:hypothetical protein
MNHGNPIYRSGGIECVPPTCVAIWAVAHYRSVGTIWGAILFAVTEFLGTGSQVPLLLVIDAI